MSVTEDVLITRRLDDGGLIEFEERTTGFRAYWYTAPDAPKRVRLPSVTTILGKISGDGGLLDWYEARGAEAALTLARQGFLDNVAVERAVEATREAGMGAKDHARKAADRGIRIHAILQAYAERGDVPNPADYAETDRGYIRGLIRWLIHADPKPVAVESLVVHPEFGYAGRLDLRARVHGKECIVDLKTNRRAQIYSKACLQTVAYHVADVRCGADPADGELLVAVGPDGKYAEAWTPDGTAEAWAAGLEYHRRLSLMGDIKNVGGS
jgi:hypothetical protein